VKAVRAYNRWKADTEDALVLRLRAAGLKRGAFAGRRISIGFVWHEHDRKRDPDNVRGGAKLVMDALARRGGFLHCDGAHCVRGFDGDCFVYRGEHGYRGPGVELAVTAWALMPPEHTRELDIAGVRLWLPGRLPDYNELSAAREQGARRMIWRQQRETGGASG
jgi:hypothetical protein